VRWCLQRLSCERLVTCFTSPEKGIPVRSEDEAHRGKFRQSQSARAVRHLEAQSGVHIKQVALRICCCLGRAMGSGKCCAGCLQESTSSHVATLALDLC
jgi:hypothetical protein